MFYLPEARPFKRAWYRGGPGDWQRHGGSRAATVVYVRPDPDRMSHTLAVDCPTCPSWIRVSPGQDRVVCWKCEQNAAGGRYAHVIWPRKARLDRAVGLLAVRPWRHRWFLPWRETVDMLVAENIEHGIISVGS